MRQLILRYLIGLLGVGAILTLKFRQDARLDPSMVLRLVQLRGDLTLLPPAVLKLDLDAPRTRPASEGARFGSTPSRAVASQGRLVSRPRPAETGRSESHGMQGSGAWWTARARSAVEPGFTKDEILAEGPFDPARPDGLFERLGELLDQLSQGLVAS